MELATMCREVRQTLKISQRAMAALAGSNQTEISFIERGFIPDSAKKIKAIEHLYEREVAK